MLQASPPFLERPNGELAEGDGAMVPLQLKRPTRDFVLFVPSGAGGIFEIHVLVDHLAVKDNALKASVLDLLAHGVESWGPKLDFEGLPLARRTRLG